MQRFNESLAMFKSGKIGSFLGNKKNTQIVLASLGIFFLVIIVFVIIYKVVYELQNPIFFRKGVNASSKIVIANSRMRHLGRGQSLTLFFWLYFDSTNTQQTDIPIVSKGAHTIRIKKGINDLEINLKSGNSGKTTLYIRDFPVRKWFSVGIIVENTSSEVYLDGKLTQSSVLNGDYIANNEDIIISDDGNFIPKSQLSSLCIYNMAKPAKFIAHRHNKGPFSSIIPLFGIFPKIKLEVDFDITPLGKPPI